MTFYAIGSELNTISDFSGNFPFAESSNWNINPNSRGTIYSPSNNGASYAAVQFVSPSGEWLDATTGLETFWTAYTATPGGGLAATLTEWHGADGVAYIRVQQISNFQFQLQYWNGSAWVQFAPGSWEQDYQTVVRYDIKIDLAAGIGQVFFNNNLVYSNPSPISLSSIPKLVSVRWYGPIGPNIGSWMVADESTRDCQIYFQAYSGNGAEQQWNGGYQNINEFPENNNAVIYTGSAGETSTFTHPAFQPVPQGYEVKALAVSALCRNDPDGGPQNMSMSINIGGTAYSLPVPTPDLDYSGRFAIWNEDPSTGQPWAGVTNVNGEKGYTSVA